MNIWLLHAGNDLHFFGKHPTIFILSFKWLWGNLLINELVNQVWLKNCLEYSYLNNKHE